MKRMTYNDIADYHDKKVGGRAARTRPMGDVARWFESLPECVVDSDGYLCLRERNQVTSE